MGDHRGSGLWKPTRPLSDLITLLAHRPTTDHQLAFYLALLEARVGARAAAPPPGFRSGGYVPEPGGPFVVPLSLGPGGVDWYTVYCDVPRLVAARPREVWFEVDGRAVLELARAKRAGVIVHNPFDGKRTWAGVGADDVPRILAGEYS